MENLMDFMKNLPKSSWKTKKRILGRGYGSGRGRTAGKGNHGQLGMSGNVRPGFEGGQTPTYRRLGKRGGGKGKLKLFYKTFIINDKLLDIKLKGAEVNVDNLVKAFRVPFYYKKIKIIGPNKSKYGEFSTGVFIKPTNQFIPKPKTY